MTAAVEQDTTRASLVQAVGPAIARRLDDLCLAGLALTPPLLSAAGWTSAELERSTHALFLGSALGCLETDYAYYRELTELGIERVNPRLFAYTVPSVVLGEIAIQHKLTGETAMISAGRASALAAICQAAAMIEAGRIDVAVVYAIDVVGPAVSRLFGALGEEVEPKPIAAAVMLEEEGSARRRGAPIRGDVISARIGTTLVGDPLRAPAARSSRGPSSVPAGARPAGDPLSADAGVRPAAARLDPLGGAGIAELLALLRAHGGPGRTRQRAVVECPTGYSAELEIECP